MTGAQGAALVAGAALIVATLVDAFEVILLPRRVRRPLRFVRGWFRGTWATWAAIGCGPVPARGRAAWFALYGPLALLGLFTVWAAGLVTGFGLVQWSLAVGAGAPPPSLLNQLYFSGVTFFTLGYGDVTAPTRAGKVVAVAEAGIGFAVLAVVVGYLPVLYQLFSQREAHVIRLDARAGSPPTTAELLSRHAVSPQGLASLGALLEEWETWSAQLLESHLSYPMLGYYRSQHDDESWLAALCTVMDSCALLAAGVRVRPPDDAGACDPDDRDRARRLDDAVPRFQARMTFAIGRLAVVEMARALHAAPEADPASPAGPDVGAIDRLPRTERTRLAAALHAHGFVLATGRPGDPVDARGERDAWTRLDAARRSYEPFLVALAAQLHLALPHWVAPADATDNWERSRGGAAARDLVETAEATEAAHEGA